MQRRGILLAGCGLVCAGVIKNTQAHTLYNQWVVYRQKHLVIGSHREDPMTYTLAKEFTSILNDKLPKARARVARAPTAERIASLMGTAQMQVALMNHTDAIAMAAGIGRFKPYGKINIKTLFLAQQYVLISRAELPDKHSWLISHALHNSELSRVDDIEPPVPWHQGVQDYRVNKPLE